MTDTEVSTGAFLRLGPPYSDFEPARFTVVGLPYEGSPGGRAGATGGPAAIFTASLGVEFFDEENFRSTARFGISTLEPEVPQGTPEETETWFQNYAERILRAGKRAFWIGGEGSITHGIARAYLNQYRDLTILQLDAHPNLRSNYQGQRFGRMTVFHRLRSELPIVQVGIRSLAEEEADLVDKGKITTFFAHDMRNRPLKAELIPDIVDSLSDHVYVNLDLSVFDPALCPAVNLPVPGGLDWQSVVEILRAVARERDIVGMDVVECVPVPGHTVTETVAARIAYKVMGFLGQFRKWPPMEVPAGE